MMNIIINADDFGINERVTFEIERMIELGCISSTTIMANGKCLKEIQRYVPLHPEISFGVHLCLSEFESLSKSDLFIEHGFMDNDGMFIKEAIFKVRHFDEPLLRAVKTELSMQIEKIQSLHIPISHADSHHHVHTIYPLRKVFSDVLHQYDIKKIRRAPDLITLRGKLHFITAYKRNKINKFYSENFKTTSLFQAYSELLNTITKQSEKNICIELMCHPGHESKIYRDEMELVENKKIDNYLLYNLISYNEL